MADDEMVAWLSATLDKMETTAIAALHPWETVAGWDGPADHVEAHSPRAVLARVEAERAIVAAHVSAGRTCTGDADAPSSWHHICSTCGSGEPYEYPTWWPCPTLRLLAHGHRFDAPGYRPEWSPDA